MTWPELLVQFLLSRLAQWKSVLRILAPLDVGQVADMLVSEWVYFVLDVVNGITHPQHGIGSDHTNQIHYTHWQKLGTVSSARPNTNVETTPINQVHLFFHVAMICIASCVTTSAKFWLYSHLVQMCEVQDPYPTSFFLGLGQQHGPKKMQKSSMSFLILMILQRLSFEFRDFFSDFQERKP